MSACAGLSPTTRRGADAALKLAREMRSAIIERDEALADALEAYDGAENDRERWEAAAIFMISLRNADAAYHGRKADAYGQFAAATKAGSRATV